MAEEQPAVVPLLNGWADAIAENGGIDRIDFVPLFSFSPFVSMIRPPIVATASDMGSSSPRVVMSMDVSKVPGSDEATQSAPPPVPVED